MGHISYGEQGQKYSFHIAKKNIFLLHFSCYMQLSNLFSVRPSRDVL